MGHSWREMDPVGAAEHDKQTKDESALRERLRHMPLSAFTAEHIPMLVRLFGYHPIVPDVRDEDIRKLSKIKRRKKP